MSAKWNTPKNIIQKDKQEKYLSYLIELTSVQRAVQSLYKYVLSKRFKPGGVNFVENS
jgi:hypothetical protein